MRQHVGRLRPSQQSGALISNALRGHVGATFSLSTSGSLDNGTVFTAHLATLNNCLMNGGAVLTTTCLAGHCNWRVPIGIHSA